MRTPESYEPGPVIRYLTPKTGAATPWSGLVHLRSKELALRQSSPPTTASPRGADGAVLSTRSVAGAEQPRLPAKSIAQPVTSWGPSLSRPVSIAWLPSAAVRHGCIFVPRHCPAMRSISQGCSVLARVAPSTTVSAKRSPEPTSVVRQSKAWTPRSQPPERKAPSSAATGLAGSSSVSVMPRTPASEVPVTEQKRSEGSAQSSLDSKAATGGEKARENSRRVVSVDLNSANGLNEPPCGAEPSRCWKLSLSTCQRAPLTVTIEVPGGAFQRQRANFVPPTADVDPRVPLVMWTPSHGSDPAGTPHHELRLNLSFAVSIQLPSLPTFQPHWATA